MMTRAERRQRIKAEKAKAELKAKVAQGGIILGRERSFPLVGETGCAIVLPLNERGLEILARAFTDAGPR